MKIKFKLTVLFFLFLALAPGDAFSHAPVHKDPIPDSYNNQIISNRKFRAKDTMSQTQIQAFLAAKGSALAGYIITFDVLIGPGDTINANGMSAAQIIYNSAQWYSINPEAILATLQKESSLVTSGNLNYLNSAMGYACPETASCNPYYANFARQIDGATYQLDYNYRHSELRDGYVGQYYVGNTTFIDGKSTYIGNSATAAFYRYTPHRPDSGWLTATNGSHYYGNYNFIYFYGLWFGSLLNEGPYLVARLSLPANERAVYLVDNNVKRYVSSKMFNEWQLWRWPLELISDTTFDSYDTESPLTNLAQNESGEVYLITDGGKRYIRLKIFNNWGFDMANVATVSNATLSYISTRDAVSYFAQSVSGSEVYAMDGGNKRYVPSMFMLNALGYPDKKITYVSGYLLGTITSGSSFNVHYVIGSGPEIYLLDKGKKRHITSLALMEAWDFDFDSKLTVSDAFLNAVTQISDLSYFTKADNSGYVYYVDFKNKKHVPSGAVLESWGGRAPNIAVVSSGLLNRLPQTGAVSRFVQESGGTRVYFVENQRKYYVPNMDILTSWGFGGFGGGLSTISSEAFTRIPFDKNMGYLARWGGKVYLVNGGVKRYMSPEMLTAWGFDTIDMVDVSTGVIQGFPEGPDVTNLAQGTNGAVYLMDGGVKRYITKFSTLLSWGYPAVPITTVSDKFLNTIPAGSNVGS